MFSLENEDGLDLYEAEEGESRMNISFIVEKVDIDVGGLLSLDGETDVSTRILNNRHSPSGLGRWHSIRCLFSLGPRRGRGVFSFS